MFKNHNIFKILFILLISGLLVLGIQGPKVEAHKKTTDPPSSYLPFMGMGMMGMGGFPCQYTNLGSLDFFNLGYYLFMSRMMGMGGFGPPYWFTGSGSDTSILSYYPYMGMMGILGFACMYPWQYINLGSHNEAEKPCGKKDVTYDIEYLESMQMPPLIIISGN